MASYIRKHCFFLGQPSSGLGKDGAGGWISFVWVSASSSLQCFDSDGWWQRAFGPWKPVPLIQRGFPQIIGGNQRRSNWLSDVNLENEYHSSSRCCRVQDFNISECLTSVPFLSQLSVLLTFSDAPCFLELIDEYGGSSSLSSSGKGFNHRSSASLNPYEPRRSKSVVCTVQSTP